MFSKRVDFDFERDNIPDWMHNLARVFIMILAIICGTHGDTSRASAWAAAGYDRRHRAECEIFGIFPSVWLDQMQELPEDVRAVLLGVTDVDIASARRPLLERWCRACGENPRGILIDDLRIKVIELIRRVRQPAPFMYEPKHLPPLPWRLTDAAFEEVDHRICNLVFPHSTETLVRNGKDGWRLNRWRWVDGWMDGDGEPFVFIDVCR